MKCRCKCCKKEFVIVHNEIINNVDGKAKVTHYLVNSTKAEEVEK